ncbi:Protein DETOXIFICATION [Quillaja saponaria]|uniref:Protein DETOXIFICATION n=1 Tax=Quillaja saponaria TaxID=32244 RepID=A0AAD7Q611_QUISA|nr:Protein DETOXIFICATION [Quillaja saponaria]
MGRVWRKEEVEEVKKQLWLGGPLLSVGLLQYSVQIISVMFVGHLGELALSGTSMATSFASVTGFNFLKVWTFELMVLLSGLLPNPKLETSVLSICLNTFGLVWMIPFGLSSAISIRVSNELGLGTLKLQV